MSENDDIEEQDASGETTSTEKKWKRVPESDWAVARVAYEAGQKGVSEIADDLGISRAAVWQRFKKDGVVKGSKVPEIAAAAAAATTSAAAATAVVKESYALKRTEWIEETRTSGYQQLKQARQLGLKIVADQIRTGGALAAIDDNLKVIQRLNKIVSDNIEVTLKLLDAESAEDGEELPVLIVEDLTDDDILAHHIMTGALPEDATLADILKDDEFE